MIVVDIETSGGLYPESIGIWQIGAVDLTNPQRTFLEEARIDDTDQIEAQALLVIGKTEAYLRDPVKQSQKSLLEHFFSWVQDSPLKMVVAHNPPFDYGFLVIKARKYGIKSPFEYRTLDLHTLACIRYYQIKGTLPPLSGKFALSLSNILSFCGMISDRVGVVNGRVVAEGKPHNGLEDAKLESECFSRLLYGAGIFEEFKKFPIPDYLRK